MRLLIAGGLVLILFAGGFAGSWYFVRKSGAAETVDSKEEPAQSSEEKSEPKGEAPANPEARAERLQRADSCLREFRLHAALASYKVLLESATTGTGPLLYRIAQCHEALGNDAKALAAYQAAADDPEFAGAQLLLQMGQARVLVRTRHPHEAIRLLYPVALAGASKAPALAADARYLLALALALRAQEPNPPSLLSSLMRPPILPVELALDLSELDGLPTHPIRGRATMEAEELQVEDAAGEKTLTRAVLAGQPAAAVLDRLVEAGGMKSEWTELAHKAAADAVLRLHVEHCPLPDVLTSAADSLDLYCQVSGDKVKFKAAVETEATPRTKFRREVAERALRAAILLQPNHALAPVALLHLAEFEIADGKEEAAVAWYQKMLRESPGSRLLLHANHNLAVLLLRAGDYPAARKACFRVIDMSPASERAATAYLQVGRMYLEEGELRLAQSHLRHACTTASSFELRPLALLTLAAAYLLDNDAKRALQELQQNRTPLAPDRWRATATFMEALAKLRLARDTGPSRYEAAQLVAAMARQREENVLGDLALHLQGQALRELGLWQDAADLYGKTLPGLRGPLRAAMQYAQAEAFLHLHKREQASTLLAALETGPDAFWSGRAMFRLAELDLEEGRAPECARRCARLWRTLHMHDNPALFQLWGHACEQQGDFERAARCFAGTPPE